MPCSIVVKGLKKTEVKEFTDGIIRLYEKFCSVNSLDRKPNKQYKKGRLK